MRIIKNILNFEQNRVAPSSIVGASCARPLATTGRPYKSSGNLWSSEPFVNFEQNRAARMFLFFATLFAFSSFSYAEMAALSDTDMQEATGQEGISISMKLDFAEGSRISTQNPKNGNNWEVIDSVTGSIEAKQLRTELLDNYIGPKDNVDGVSAAQTVFPDEINFGSFKTRGIYLGTGKEVIRDADENITSNHNFFIGMEIDGSLKLPAQTKLTTFVVK